MNIQGLDYNTQRERLRMPEYGRCIHQMVDYCMSLADRQERQRCAETIVKTMEMMNPELKRQPDYKQKLWDHLAIMSNFELDIDYPYDISNAKSVTEKPGRMAYPKTRIPVKHYGNLVFKTLGYLKQLPAGPERDALAETLANQMKRDVAMYGSANPDDDRILSDITKFTDGAIQLDPNDVKLVKITAAKKNDNNGGKKKKKK